MGGPGLGRVGVLPSLLLPFLVGCSDSGITALDLDTFDAVPTQIEFDGTTYFLSPFVWRSFDEIREEWWTGSKLLASIIVFTVDDTPIPWICEPGKPGNSCRWHISVVESFVKNRETGKIWATNKVDSMGLTGNSATRESKGVSYAARGGPRWGPGILVDVVVKVRSLNGEKALLRAENVWVYGIG